MLAHFADLDQRVVRINFALTVHAALATTRTGTGFHGDVIYRPATAANSLGNGTVANIGTNAYDHGRTSKCVELEINNNDSHYYNQVFFQRILKIFREITLKHPSWTAHNFADLPCQSGSAGFPANRCALPCLPELLSKCREKHNRALPQTR